MDTARWRGERKWTYVVYMAGDNELEGRAVEAVNEIEAVNWRGADVSVLVLIDRTAGYDATDGDWSGTRLWCSISSLSCRAGRRRSWMSIIRHRVFSGFINIPFAPSGGCIHYSESRCVCNGCGFDGRVFILRRMVKPRMARRGFGLKRICS